MDTKLTLKLDGETIEAAKRFAQQQGVSLSRLIESLLDVAMREQSLSEVQVSPFVKSLSKGRSVPIDIDDKAPRKEILMRKHA